MNTKCIECRKIKENLGNLPVCVSCKGFRCADCIKQSLVINKTHGYDNYYVHYCNNCIWFDLG